jgi:hypothetical protein
MSHHSPWASVGNSFRSAGKALERTALQMRSYFVPSHIWTYWKMVRRHNESINGNGEALQFAFFDFTRAEIDDVSGRYLYGLVRDFEALGFLPCYRKSFRFLATMEHKRFKSYLLQRPFRVCSSPAELPAGSTPVVVTDRRVFPESPARRHVRVRYEPVWPQSDREVPMTFFVHPAVYDHLLAAPPPDLVAPRAWRVFFAGRVLNRKYGLNLLPKRFGKMSRRQIIEAVESSLPPGRLRRVESEAELDAVAVRHPCFVRADSSRYVIPKKDWLNRLNHADFFLACPGMDMPLCHNLVEALARAAVPILEHPEFLEPPLEHDVNCLVFRGRDELLRTFDRVLELGPDQIARLRQGAHDYYRKHLAPGAFARRLLDHPHPCVDVLLNAYRTPRLYPVNGARPPTNGH